MAQLLTPEERSLRARIAAHAMHAANDTREVSAPGRKAFLDSFEKQVDPEGKLPEAERRRRAEHARKAHMARLAFKSARARRKEGGDGVRTKTPPDPRAGRHRRTLRRSEHTRAS